MIIIDQFQWEAENQEFLHKYINKSAENPRWGKINYGFSGEVDGEKTQIRYTDFVDLTTYDMYIKKPNHDSKMRSIFWSMIIVRPFRTLCKTVYHLCLPISIPVEIYETIKEERAKALRHPEEPRPHIVKACAINVGKSLLDIVRTPLYGLALTIIAIAGVIISYVKPEWIHEIRKIHGKVELQLCWGKKEKCLVQCFQPMENLMKIKRRNRTVEGINKCRIKAFNDLEGKKPKTMQKTNIETIEYQQEKNPIIFGLANWAYSQANHQTKLNSQSQRDRCLIQAKAIFLG